MRPSCAEFRALGWLSLTSILTLLHIQMHTDRSPQGECGCLGCKLTKGVGKADAAEAQLLLVHFCSPLGPSMPLHSFQSTCLSGGISALGLDSSLIL